MNVPVAGQSSILLKGDKIGGYHLNRVVELKEIDCKFYEFEHTVLGCRHVHIESSDRENTFSVAFKTVPADSTGVAHILEHTVLCGSRRYPVRDPFFSMLKRSLSTFMNAFTSSDWTMYPFSTQNRKDFYNLMEVYLDAAFFPNLTEMSFKQEGHRLEVEPSEPDSDSIRLVYKGVVYNEMKGAMSSPDQVMVRSLLNALYPSSTYRFNSGGDPAEIPRLTHGDLVAFHKRHYHPSNAFFYTYGNLPVQDHLAFIEKKVLKYFKRIDPHTGVLPQTRWDHPKTAVYTYPLGRHEEPAKKCQVCIGWLTEDIQKSFDVLTLTLLEQILLGNAASPLRKALMDSGLGSSLSDGTGFDADLRDMLFACGLKDVAESSADQIREIVFSVLKDLVANGIDRELIESAIHQLEFHRKEVTNHPYPYGLKLLLQFCGSWFHGGDPVSVLKFDEDLMRLNRELEKGPFFENRIKSCMLDNPHRIDMKLVPDPGKEEAEARRTAEELSAKLQTMDRTDVENIRKDSGALKRFQDETEDVSCLPTLELDDIPKGVHIVKASGHLDDLPVTFYRQPTSGIFYVSAVFGAGNITPELVGLMPFFCYAFSKSGTRCHDYVEMARRIDRYTGGVGLSANARTRFDVEKAVGLPFVMLGGKCLDRNQEPMMDILRELVCDYGFSDLTRLKTLLLQYRAGLESAVVHNGHALAISLASRNFSPTTALSEAWNGVHQLRTIKDLTRDLSEKSLQELSGNLMRIAGRLFTKNNIQTALVGEEPSLVTGDPLARSLIGSLVESTENGFAPPQIKTEDFLPREGWWTTSAVSFVARIFETVRMDHEDAPVLSVVSKLLRSMYLHREIREKGGAYGGFALYNSDTGLFGFASYRDPHIVSTLKVYDGVESFIVSGDYSDEDIKEAVLQVCSEFDRPDPPGPAARKAFLRDIVGISDELRQQFKSRLLTITRRDVIRIAETYFTGRRENSSVAVVSGEDALKQANLKLVDDPLTLHQI